jgi:hypothetical protein
VLMVVHMLFCLINPFLLWYGCYMKVHSWKVMKSLIIDWLCLLLTLRIWEDNFPLGKIAIYMSLHRGMALDILNSFVLTNLVPFFWHIQRF